MGPPLTYMDKGNINLKEQKIILWFPFSISIFRILLLSDTTCLLPKEFEIEFLWNTVWTRIIYKVVTRIGAISIERASRISKTLEPRMFIMFNYVYLTEKKHSDRTWHQHHGSRNNNACTVLLAYSSHYERLQKVTRLDELPDIADYSCSLFNSTG